MQIKGEEFIKKVQKQQEREELEQKLNELEEAEQNYVEEDPIIIDNSISNTHGLNDIMLEPNELPAEQDNTKKKYIILAIILVVLFLFTIFIIRLLTNDEKEDSFTSQKVSSNEINKLEQNSNIEENFQKIINERIKKDTKVKKENTSEENINQIEESSSEKDMEQKLDETIKKIEEKTKEIKKQERKSKKKPVKKVVKEKPKKSIKKLIAKSEKTTTSIKGHFVQIGAFKNTPSNSYINKIRKANLKYKIYKTTIKGTAYNKVLIGPYSSRVLAKKEIESIKTKLNLSSAYVLSF